MVPEKNVPITIDLKPSTMKRYLPEDVKTGLRNAATIMIAGQPWGREMLPVIVNTGASISLWMASAVKDGCLRAWLDVANPTTITGVGAGLTHEQTATVIIPGNINNTNGDYPPTSQNLPLSTRLLLHCP